MTDDTEARLRALEDKDAILDRLYAYGHAIDYGLRDVWLDCWTPDAVLAWPHESYEGHEAILGAFDAHSHAPEAYHKHCLIEPRLRLDGDTAVAESYFARIDERPAGPLLRSFGRYRDTLVRCDDGAWRIVERICERESLIPNAPVT
jgi:ketosteroid isomerase-like protein